MAAEKRHPAAQDGADAARKLVAPLKALAESYSSDEETLLFWSAFLSRVAGYCVASIGPKALHVMADELKAMGDKAMRSGMQ